MNNYKYLKLSKKIKIRYLNNFFKKKLYIIFLPGFMSDIEGKKPRAFKRFAVRKKLGFLTIEYSGHGRSSGKFIDGNISKWSDQSKKSIQKLVRKNKFILIGSSMGAWIALNQFKIFKKQIVGFIGIGSAPEFLERLMWNKFPKKVKNEIKKRGISTIKHGNKKNKYEYPISYQLIKDGKKNKVLSKKIYNKINVSMFHGQKDEAVPVSFSRKVLSLFPNAKKKLIVIKRGDHSLSQKNNIKKIINELNFFISNVS